MTERIHEGQMRAAHFEALHVHLPRDFEAYRQAVLEQWKKDAERALAEGRAVQPTWLRTNADDTDEVGAHVEYVIPKEDDTILLYAAIDIGSDELETWLPKGDGSNEPVVVMREAYSLDALDRAIELIETTWLSY